MVTNDDAAFDARYIDGASSGPSKGSSSTYTHASYDPIAYNTWIREQIVDNLGLPDVYEQLPRLFELDSFERGALDAKAEELRRLTEAYVIVD